MLLAFRLILGAYPIPEWFADALGDGRLADPDPLAGPNNWGRGGVIIRHGYLPDELVKLGDWVIMTEDNELHGVRAADFEWTYCPPPPVPRYQGKRADWIIVDDLDCEP